VRADVLFELNGCGKVPEVVFVPGVNWSPKIPDVPGAGTFNAEVFSRSPLPLKAEIGLKYGWQLQSSSDKVSFHSGIDLQAKVGTPVLAVGSGTVAYVGDRGSYGNLVAINHKKGKQTRYAHLKSVAVRAGETVSAGDRVGTVGTTGAPDIEPPHLHFEIRYNSDLGWVAEDPQSYLQAIVERKRESIGAAKHSIKKGSDRTKINASQDHRAD
jgi:lysostaphin